MSSRHSNVVTAPREHSLGQKQDPSVIPHKNLHYSRPKVLLECGDSLDGIFDQRCTFSARNRDEFIKVSVEILVQSPSESKGVSQRDSFSSNDVEYVEGITPKSEPVRLDGVEIVIPELED
ncbi:hypothetical protein Tco_1107252 [Tanacetum coccineum]